MKMANMVEELNVVFASSGVTYLFAKLVQVRLGNKLLLKVVVSRTEGCL